MKRKYMNQPLARPLTPREKGIRNKYVALFVIATLTALTLAVHYNNQSAEIHQLQNVVDSLRDETFHLNTVIGRYELTIEHLKEVDSTVAVEAERFLDHETE